MGLQATRVGPTSCTSRSGPRLRGARPASRIFLSWTRSGLSRQVSPPPGHLAPHGRQGGGSGQNTGRRPLLWCCLLPATAPKAAAGVRRVARGEVRAGIESVPDASPGPSSHPPSRSRTSQGSRAPEAWPIEFSPAHSGPAHSGPSLAGPRALVLIWSRGGSQASSPSVPLPVPRLASTSWSLTPAPAPAFPGPFGVSAGVPGEARSNGRRRECGRGCRRSRKPGAPCHPRSFCAPSY